MGSANFTGKGIGHAKKGNEEIVFETQCVKEVADWFERRWEKIGCLDEELLSNYSENYKQPGKGRLDERPDSLSEIIFKSHGRGSRGYRGDCRFVWSSGSEEKLRYETHQAALEIVLRKLSRDFQDEQLLESIERDGYKIKEKPLLAADWDRLYRKPNQDRRHNPRLLEPSGWWIYHDTDSKQKRKFIEHAAELANVQITWDQNSKNKYRF